MTASSPSAASSAERSSGLPISAEIAARAAAAVEPHLAAEEAAAIEPAERDVRVGDRRLRAAAAVAGGPGREPALSGPTCSRPPGGRRRSIRRPRRWCGSPPSAGAPACWSISPCMTRLTRPSRTTDTSKLVAAHVDADDVRFSRGAGPAARRRRFPPTGRRAGGARLLRRRLGAAHAAIRLHQQQARIEFSARMRARACRDSRRRSGSAVR